MASPPAADLAETRFVRRPGSPPGYGLREGPARRWITVADDDIDKSSAPRGGGSVGRGALNLLLREFVYRRPHP